jgi:hypothetical protein
MILDLQNLFLRVRYGMRAPDIDAQVGMSLHICLTSIKKVWNQFNGQHLVVCLEGRSWRKDVYPIYKNNRKAIALARTPREVEDDKVFFEIMDDFIQFMKTQTNATVLQHQNAEADDLIARWIFLHPEDDHVIISTDSDFQQLIAPNVKIYNGIAGLLYTDTGIFDKDNNPALDKKNQPLPAPNPGWLLFEKCIRGDAGDNVMSAFPGVRKNRMQAAWDDRTNKGFDWNNLMLSKWTDQDGVEHRVKDDYERNCLLVDLTKIPPDLVDKFDRMIVDAVLEPVKKQVGINLIRFCNKHGLVRIEKNSSEFSSCLSSSYQGYLLSYRQVENDE